MPFHDNSAYRNHSSLYDYNYQLPENSVHQLVSHHPPQHSSLSDRTFARLATANFRPKADNRTGKYFGYHCRYYPLATGEICSPLPSARGTLSAPVDRSGSKAGFCDTTWAHQQGEGICVQNDALPDAIAFVYTPPGWELFAKGQSR
jgi:hypothetical protein